MNFGVDILQTEHPFTGKLVYASAAGIPMIFLNDFQANEDLLNIRGDKYADKPHMVMLNELCNGKYMVSIHLAPLPTPLISFQLPFIGVNDADRVRRQRKIMRQALGPGAIPSYEPSIEAGTRQLLFDLASKDTTIENALLKYGSLLHSTPPPDICIRYTSSIILLILYGHQVVSTDDELVKITGEAAEVLSNGIAAGAKVWAVDIFPFRE